MLTGSEILKRKIEGDIVIEPFDIDNLNPNSYNLTLAPELKVYANKKWIEGYDEDLGYYNERLVIIPLDLKKENETTLIQISDNGYILKPGRLYLAKTNEYTETHNLIPFLNGRSSIGRKGLFVHVTAGFGDIGFCGNWTLELTCVEPVIIYPNIKICQISYDVPTGEIIDTYKGKYQGDREIAESRLFQEYVTGA